MVRVHVLDVNGTLDPHPCAQIDRLVRDTRFASEIAIRRIRISDEQHVRVERRRQMLVQLCFCDWAIAGDEIAGLAGPVARDQDSDLLVRDTALGGRTPSLARRPGQLASTFLRLEYIKLISLCNAVQALRPVVLGQR